MLVEASPLKIKMLISKRMKIKALPFFFFYSYGYILEGISIEIDLGRNFLDRRSLEIRWGPYMRSKPIKITISSTSQMSLEADDCVFHIIDRSSVGPTQIIVEFESELEQDQMWPS